MTTRRGFLSAALAACAAPAYVKAGILMPVKKVWTPPLMGMDFGSDAWGMVRWVETRPDGSLVFKERLLSRKEVYADVVNISRPVRPYEFPTPRWLDRAEAKAMFPLAP